MAKQTKFSVAIPGDLTKSAMARIIQQLMSATDGDEEQEVLDQLGQDSDDALSNADLQEEKRGAVSKIAVDDDTPKKDKKRG